MTTGAPAVFLDKDGTLVENVPFSVDQDDVRLTPNTLEAYGRDILPVFSGVTA